MIAVIMGSYYESSDRRPLVPYYDSVGVATVCNGVTGPDVVWGKRYTEQECILLESKHLKKAEDAAKRLLPGAWDRLNRWQQAVIIDFTYNKGDGALAGSTLRKKFLAGDIVGGCNELLKWVKARDRKTGTLEVLPGLVVRAEDTNEMCLYWKD